MSARMENMQSQQIYVTFEIFDSQRVKVNYYTKRNHLIFAHTQCYQDVSLPGDAAFFLLVIHPEISFFLL